MAVHAPLPGRGEEGWPRGAASEDLEVSPAPFPLALGKQRKMEAGEEPGLGWGESGKAERSWGRRRPEREKWVAKREGRRRRRRGRPRPERTAGRGILAEQAAGGMEPRRPGGSQRKGRARRSRYLCGRSERPRGSRVLQQFHLDLLRHHRRRCGRRLGHVALDHWRKVGREPAARPPRPTPPGGGSPPPSPSCPLRGPPGGSRRSGCGARPGQVETLGAGEPGGGGAGRASAERAREPPAPGQVLAEREGAPAARAQGEARRPARVTGHRNTQKFPAGGAGRRGPGRSRRASPWHARWKVFKAAKARPRARGLPSPGCPVLLPPLPAGGNRSLRRGTREAPRQPCAPEISRGLEQPRRASASQGPPIPPAVEITGRRQE